MTIHEQALAAATIGKTPAMVEQIIQAYLRAFLTDPELVEKVAVVISPGFFGESAKGWEDNHAINMQENARKTAQAALSVIKQEAGLV